MSYAFWVLGGGIFLLLTWLALRPYKLYKVRKELLVIYGADQLEGLTVREALFAARMDLIKPIRL